MNLLAQKYTRIPPNKRSATGSAYCTKSAPMAVKVFATKIAVEEAVIVTCEGGS